MRKQCTNLKSSQVHATKGPHGNVKVASYLFTYLFIYLFIYIIAYLHVCLFAYLFGFCYDYKFPSILQAGV